MGRLRLRGAVLAISAGIALLSPAPAAAQSFTLTVRLTGNTSGTVSVVPIAGLCNTPSTVCTFEVPTGTSVRLSANGSVPGLFFNGIGPTAGCSLTTCGFTMSAAAEVTASFDASNGPTATVITTLVGDGRGSVGVDNSLCQNFDATQSSGCTTSYLTGSVVSLTGSAAAGSRFTRYANGTGGDGACAMSATCSFTLTANATVTATFSSLQQLVVTPSSVTRPVGHSQVFTARGAYSDGVTEDVSPGNGTWVRRAPMPTRRFTLAAAAAGDRVYAIGGMAVTGFTVEPVPTVEAYDPKSNTWTSRAPMATARASFGIATVAGQIYAIGGINSQNEAVASVERYDPATDTWTPRAPLPQPRATSALGVVNGIIYVLGGAASGGVVAYDPSTDSWTPKAPVPSAGGGVLAGVVGGTLYALGICVVSETGAACPGPVDAYDAATNTWTSRAPMPVIGPGWAAAVVGDALLVVGRGLTYQYDAARDVWSTKSGPPSFVGFRGLAALEGLVYAIGGGNIPDRTKTYSDAVEAFTDHVLWSSSAPSLVAVTQQGLASAARIGTATISTSVGSQTSGPNSATFTVTAAVPTDMALDAPANGSQVVQPFTIRGWALNRGAVNGTGVDAVHVYAFPSGGGSPIFLGPAVYGSARPDVAAIFGAQFTNCGFTLSTGSGPGLPKGPYTLVAYAHNAITGTFDKSQSTTITVFQVQSYGVINIDSPTDGAVVNSAFEIGGWAIDYGAPSGTGIDAIQFYVIANDGGGPFVFVGTGSYGAPRPDVGGIYGSRFTNSGYHFTITGLGPGKYVLGAYARSTVTGEFSVLKFIHISINANQLMSIDTPAPESSVSAGVFDVAGWAIDRAVATGTGVDSLHVYAYPNPGSGQAPIFLGVATVGFARSDVAALYGARFTNSGYNLTVDRAAVGMTPGVYSIVVHSHSTSGTFNNLAVVRVTVQ